MYGRKQFAKPVNYFIPHLSITFHRAAKRITISLTEEQFDNFWEVLPTKANIAEVVCDMIDMFVSACERYGDEFVLDVMCLTEGSFR